MDDINDAIQCSEQAVASSFNKENIDWPDFADILAQSLYRRFERMGDREDREKCIALRQQALNHKTLAEDNPDRRCALHNLGAFFMSLYFDEGHVKELEMGMKFVRESLEQGEASGDSTTVFHFQRAYTLGMGYYHLYLETPSASHIEEAFQHMKCAVSGFPDDHPDISNALLELGHIYEALGNIDQALDCYLQSTKNHFALPIARVRSARAAIRIYQEKGEWANAVPLARDAMNLLHLICSRYSDLRDQEYAIIESSGLAADACSIFLMSEDPEEALQQLEFGRGLILGYLVDSRDDLTAMKTDPAVRELVERYEILRQMVAEGTSEEDTSRRRDEVIEEIQKCIEDIRKLPRYKAFLEKPSIEGIKTAAAHGPIIVVNYTDIGAHAIINWDGNVKSLALDGLLIETAPAVVQKRLERQRSSARRGADRRIGSELSIRPDDVFLSWLWDNCVKLVFDELETLGFPLDGQQRLWWIGTGVASSLPFHAAGTHYSQPKQCTLSKVVSSYTPTIKILEFSRAQASRCTRVEGQDTLLFLAMPTTPGNARELPGVYQEEAALKEACGETFLFEPHIHPTASEALERIPKSKVVHFACHGVSNQIQPSKSHLLLQKKSGNGMLVDRLTVAKLAKVGPQEQTWLAFLSACSTAEVKAGRLSDQALHLTSIFQVSGFAHTIGALWSVDDEVCGELARDFYKALIADGDYRHSNDIVARALHYAIGKLRSDSNDAETWAPFVHFGA